ncbi:pseudaminic acid synthase [Nonlabens sp. Asnod3-A02]|uniref:pseudaminic acid synthase n=1 Tax=Nonlabens sp. Asnod3-A02 TaxID=3160579 RepID=UPI003866649C
MNNKVFIIAELSANHNNNLDLALKTIDAIADTGADAVKVQTYTADSLTLNVDNEYFGPRKDGLWKGKTLYELYEKGSLPYEWHITLKEYTEKLGMVFFSSPFDFNAVDFLETLDVPLYKIASPEITDIPLIKYVAEKGKPMIISTGMAALEDIDLAVNTCRNAGNNDITLLKCTSEYPAPISMANLKTMNNLAETFGVKVGLSDHTFGSTLPIAATVLGAQVIEKHIVLDRESGGIDAAFSLEPEEFKNMVKGVREASEVLGDITYNLTDRNKLRRRSLFVSSNVNSGDVISTENIKSVRPGNGLHPQYYSEVIGKTFTKNVSAGTPLSFDLIQD